jgi:hypothetical protein
VGIDWTLAEKSMAWLTVTRFQRFLLVSSVNPGLASLQPGLLCCALSGLRNGKQKLIRKMYAQLYD